MEIISGDWDSLTWLMHGNNKLILGFVNMVNEWKDISNKEKETSKGI